MHVARILTPTILALFSASSTAFAVDLPHYDASYDAAATNLGPRDVRAPKRKVSTSKPNDVRLNLPLRITGTNVRRDAPVFAWAGGAPVQTSSGVKDPKAAARFHLDKLAPAYDLPAAAVAASVVRNVHDTGRGGFVVSLGQDVDGVEVFRERMNLLLARNFDLVAVGGSLHRGASVQTKDALNRWQMLQNEAIARALGDLYSIPVNAGNIVEMGKTPGGYTRFELSPAMPTQTAQYRFDRPARIKKVYFPLAERLVPGYYVELFSGKVNSRATDTYAYVIAADDGRVLYRSNLTAHAAFNYRVWAETTGNKRPLDAPIEDFTPNPTGIPDGSYPAFIPPVLVSMDGFNKSADPWLPSGATETRGNNVDAYSDDDSPDGFSANDIRATTTAANTFDRVYDTAMDPLVSSEQTMAAITQLFYTVNWMHDSWYDSGFDEAAGNAQINNYGRGGMDNDPLLAEAQDGALLGYIDNANMSTPADGESPVMQMFLWSGKASGSVGITQTSATYEPGFASFGLPQFEITGDVVLAADATDPINDICSAVVNDVNGKIALIDRGNCAFESKASEAQKAGAIGVIIANHTAGAPAPDMPSGGNLNVTIPILSVTFEDGKAIKDALSTGKVTAKLSRSTGVRPDGTIDATVSTHEWGHYLHNRLVSCNTNQCGGEGEGWGDFIALTTMVREKDNLGGTYTSSIYAPVAYRNAAYFGDRRYPYSTNLAKNPLTFKYIGDGVVLPPDIPNSNNGISNSEVHNTGEIWASMLFEAYVNLLEESKKPNPRYTFVEAQRRMQDYVVAGMKLAPVDPTFTEQRDAILAAALAADTQDALLIAKGFAKRGAGSCAVAPDRESEDNSGVVESYDVTPAIAITSVKLEAGADQCDGDGVIDAHEKATLTIEMRNTGIIELGKGELSVSSSFPGLQFLNGSTASLANVPPLGTITQKFDVQIGGPNEPSVLPFDVKITSDETCAKEVNQTARFRVNYDNAAAVSTTDAFESDINVWQTAGTGDQFIWSRTADDELNYVWHGNDLGFSTDTQLESPIVEVSPDEDLVISFKHRYGFEASPEMDGGPDQYWDGGVIEISGPNGPAWEDIAMYADPGYDAPIYDQPGNELAARMAYISTSSSWPDMETVTLSFGKMLAGKKIKIRFRIGSDSFVGAYGWDIDDVSFQGIVGTPFPALVPSQKICNEAPIANAGTDGQASTATNVMLDASKSSDPDGDSLTFQWSQVAGPFVEFDDVTSKTPTFIAPGLQSKSTLTFQVAVSDSLSTSVDTVNVVVEEAPAVAGGGGCNMVSTRKTGNAPCVIGAFLGLAAWRRRNRHNQKRRVC